MTKTSAKIIFIAVVVVLKVYSSYGLLGDAHFSEMIGGENALKEFRCIL